MDPHGRGRGRGRVREALNGGLAPGPQPQQAPQPSGGAWPRPPAPTQSFQHMVGQGRKQEHSIIPRTIQGTTSGDGYPGPSLPQRGGGDGSVRGRMANRTDILKTRPDTLVTKQGHRGTKVRLQANYFQLKDVQQWGLLQHRVDFAPEIDDTKKRKFLVRTAIKEIIKHGYLFDGTLLYTVHRLHPDPIELVAADDDGENYKISIRLVGEVKQGDYHYLQLFNIIMRKCLQLMKMQQVGRNYYLPSKQVVLKEHKIQLWPGYFTSIRQHERHILLNVDLQFKFMRTDNVYDLFTECLGANLKREFSKKIIGSVVLTYYNNKTYRVDDIDWECTPQHTFLNRDKKPISYIDYYKDKYKIQINVPNQPMLISRSKAREIHAGKPEIVYLVPQLCQLTGLSENQRANFNLMKQLANHTRIGPGKRIEELRNFAKELLSKPDCVQEIRRWDMEIANQLVEIQGRCLNPEQILAGGGEGNYYSAGANVDWQREVRQRPIHSTGMIVKLAIIVPARLRNETQTFMKCLVQAANGMKWNIDNYRIIEMPDDRINTYLEACEHVINSAQPSLIMPILPRQSSELYSSIKKKCYVDRGMPCQIVCARNLTSKGVMSIATKVAIQINCKLNGFPWSVHIPLKSLMVVGYDVSRDIVNKKKTFAGMVASIDRSITSYFNRVFEHSSEEELSHNFGTFLLMALNKWRSVNDEFPERILIYRDGVGDGQINYVVDQEVENIKRSLTERIYTNGNLKLAFIIVSKRINTRIFAGGDNPRPGTVVDDVITLPERYDFYLVSQCVRQGTVSPTNYNIIENTIGLDADQIQLLTYKFTHMYYNWSGTVRVPAPCQYAHKLAFLTSQSLHRAAHQQLESLLFFL